ncbi:glutathione reductase [Acetobacter oeni LMG 21952]|nr:glutathione reductase [Acetobacter oeni LMG 21952]
MIAKHRIAWHEKTLGQLFCDGSARSVLAMLLDECAAGNVSLRLSETIQDVRHNGQFVVKTDSGVFEAPAMVLACGGLSIPKLGATGLAYRLAGQFGVPVVSTAPGLVPLQLPDDVSDRVKALAGVSLPVRVTCGKATFDESMLFTHRGLSGPAILQISSYWRDGQSLSTDLLPGKDAFTLLKTARTTRSRAHAVAILSEWLPRRLAEALGPGLLGEKAAGEWSDKLLRSASAALKAWSVTPDRSEGYAKAEVTTGGIDTRALSSRSMEITEVPGLYAVGEAVDVTGWLGGYNFHWAWASGRAAGNAIAG